MSIESPNTIDFLSIDQGGARVVLAISDHWDWSAPMEHLLALQEKINYYMAFVEGGQVWESATETSGRAMDADSATIEVRIFLRHEPPPLFFEFMENAKEVLSSLGVTIGHELRKGS